MITLDNLEDQNSAPGKPSDTSILSRQGPLPNIPFASGRAASALLPCSVFGPRLSGTQPVWPPRGHGAVQKVVDDLSATRLGAP